MKQDEFYQALAEVPAVPDTLYQTIEVAIRHRRSASRIRWAIAASLICALGITSYISLNKPAVPEHVVSTTLSDETVAELQALSGFVNGITVEEETGQYTLVSMDHY